MFFVPIVRSCNSCKLREAVWLLIWWQDLHKNCIALPNSNSAANTTTPAIITNPKLAAILPKKKKKTLFNCHLKVPFFFAISCKLKKDKFTERMLSMCVEIKKRRYEKKHICASIPICCLKGSWNSKEFLKLTSKNCKHQKVYVLNHRLFDISVHVSNILSSPKTFNACRQTRDSWQTKATCNETI